MSTAPFSLALRQREGKVALPSSCAMEGRMKLGDHAAVILGLISVALITLFSWLAALSIGPFVVAAAVLVTA